MMGGVSNHNEGILAGIDCDTGDFKTIDQVVSGKACNCICPECRIRLVAKKGRYVTHHFAHKHLPDDIRSCQETALHVAAKTVAAHLIDQLDIPQRKEPFSSTEKVITRAGAHELVNDQVTVKGDLVDRLSGTMEPIVPEISPFRPDAKVQTIAGEIFIEIHVTNPVPPEKQSAMSKEDLAVLELDFSKVPRSGISMNEIRELVTAGAPRHWLSTGLRRFIPTARAKLDASIRDKERQEMDLLFSRLKKDDMSVVGGSVVVNAVKQMFYGRVIHLTGKLEVSNLRNLKGFWLADLPGAPGVLLTTMNAEWRLNRLFEWHRVNRGTTLTLLSINRKGTCLYSNSQDIVNTMTDHLTKHALQVRQAIRKVRVIDRGNNLQSLPQTLTPKMIEEMGSRVYVGEDLPDSTVYELITNDFAELVVNVTGDHVLTYAHSQLIKKLEGTRLSGGPREQLTQRVQDTNPCRVRFVPSLPEPLDGNAFEFLMMKDDGLYLNIEGFGVERVYFQRSEFWGKRGVLVTPDPVHRDDFRLEPSADFLSDFTEFSQPGSSTDKPEN